MTVATAGRHRHADPLHHRGPCRAELLAAGLAAAAVAVLLVVLLVGLEVIGLG